MTNYAQGGNDLIVGDLSLIQNLYGDAGGDMSEHAIGGIDHIIILGSL